MTRLPEGGGISFYGLGVAYSDGDLNLSGSLDNEDLSISIWLKPVDTGEELHYKRLLTLYDTQTETELFSLGQWRSTLMLHSVHSKPSGLSSKAGVGNALKTGKRVFITVTSSSGGTTVFLDAEPVDFFTDFTLLPAGKAVAGRLIVGNSPGGMHQWSGELYGLALYRYLLTPKEVFVQYLESNRSGSIKTPAEQRPVAFYAFDEAEDSGAPDGAGAGTRLSIPVTYKALQPVVLGSFIKEFRPRSSYYKDVTLNFLGFVPFGLVFILFLKSRAYLSRFLAPVVVIVTGAGISLSIELLQVYLPTRASSTTDIIANTAGTAAGVALFYLYNYLSRAAKTAVGE